MLKALIIDGYIDEPANLGVPPYISTYIRYIAGAFYLAGFDVKYITIDQYRDLWDKKGVINSFDAIITIAGTTVPGHYLGGTPASITEIKEIGKFAKKPVSFIAGPVLFGYSIIGGTVALESSLDEYDFKIYNDPEIFVFNYFHKGLVQDTKRNYEFLEKVACEGAQIVKQHPRFPYVICELETSRGCDRNSFCSFCTEPFYNPISFRSINSITREIKALYDSGCRFFRLGRQANFYAYQGKGYKHGFLKPNAQAIKTLFSEIKSVAPKINVLHIDNVNPGTIYHFPDEAANITQTIVDSCTEGNIASLGVESFDPEVIFRNNLNSKPEYTDFAVKLINDIGNIRRNGIPVFLPGINLLYGLAGESRKTYEINYRHLMTYLEKGYLLRRINIRKSIVFKGTPLGKIYSTKPIRINNHLYNKYKNMIRENIDQPMLKKVFPVGTILKDVIPEKFDKNITWGRQMGTYPILIGIPENIPLFEPIDIIILDYGFRSLTGFPYPININRLNEKNFCFFPGIGQKTARNLQRNKPFKDINDFLRFIPDPELKKFYSKLRYRL